MPCHIINGHIPPTCPAPNRLPLRLPQRHQSTLVPAAPYPRTNLPTSDPPCRGLGDPAGSPALLRACSTATSAGPAAAFAASGAPLTSAVHLGPLGRAHVAGCVRGVAERRAPLGALASGRWVGHRSRGSGRCGSNGQSRRPCGAWAVGSCSTCVHALYIRQIHKAAIDGTAARKTDCNGLCTHVSARVAAQP